eukprot:3635707-Pleurochrysis_carterae.AAC.1
MSKLHAPFLEALSARLSVVAQQLSFLRLEACVDGRRSCGVPHVVHELCMNVQPGVVHGRGCASPATQLCFTSVNLCSMLRKTQLESMKLRSSWSA